MPAAAGAERAETSAEELLPVGRVGVYSVDNVRGCARDCGRGASLKKKSWK